MIQMILSILAGMLSLYTLLCFIYILMSWFPGARFTKFGHIMSAICEPYMNLFRKMSFLRIGNIDFSPIVSIGILSLASAILAGIQRTGAIFFGAWAEWFFTQEGFYAIGGKIMDTFSGSGLAIIYSIFYNGLYMIPEIIITAIVAFAIGNVPYIAKKSQ